MFYVYIATNTIWTKLNTMINEFICTLVVQILVPKQKIL